MASFYQPRTQLTDASWFYGRKNELRQLFSFLNKPNPQNVQIVGQRRIGKSWFLQKIALDSNLQKEYLDNPEEFTFIYWDLQQELKLSPDIFLKQLMNKILMYIPNNLQVECQKVAQQEEISEAIWEVMELLEVAEHKVIFLIDEFAAITKNTSFAEDFFTHLRAIFGRPAFTCITASFLSLGEMCHLGPDSPFFNIFSRIQLGLYAKEEAGGFVQEPFESLGVEINQHAIKAILRLSGQHPCFISQLCHELYHATKDKGIITTEDVELLNGPFQAFIFDDYRYYWQRLNETERGMLIHIAEGDQPNSLENPIFLKLERLSLVHRDQKKAVIFSIPFSQFVKDSKGTDIYFQKAFSDIQFSSASFALMAKNILDASENIPADTREHLSAAIQTMQSRPQEAMRTCGRDVLTPLLNKVFKAEFGTRPYGDLNQICVALNDRARERLFPRHIAAHFHSLRTSGNDGSHAEEYIQACTPARAFLTVLETIHLAEEVYKRYQ